MREVRFTSGGREDFDHWIRTDRKLAVRIGRIIGDLRADPFEGIGKPEPLKGALAGCWSRRIDQEHRLVYRVTNDAIVVLQARYHYDD